MKPLYCTRSRHKLAERVAVDGHLAVTAQTVVQHRAGLRRLERTFTGDELDGLETLTVWVSCACGTVQSLDLIAARDGRWSLSPVPTGRDDTGVSYNRLR